MMVKRRLLSMLTIAVLLGVTQPAKLTIETTSKSKHAVLAFKRYGNDRSEANRWPDRPVEDEDTDDDNFDSDSFQDIDNTHTPSRSVEWRRQVSPAKKHFKLDFNLRAQAKSTLSLLPFENYPSQNKICNDIRCQPDEYCFAPEPGTAECLKRPLAMNSKNTEASDIAHQSLLIDIDGANQEREEEDEDESEERENSRDSDKNAPSKRNNDINSNDSDNENSYEANDSYHQKFNQNHITNERQTKRKSKVKDTESDDEDDDRTNQSDSSESNESNRSGMRNLKTKKNSNNIYLPSESQSAAYNNSKIVQCPSCRVSRTRVVCGTDNASYSSICRLEFHNCIHQSDVKLACLGFCPCPTSQQMQQKPTNKKQLESASLKSQYYSDWFKDKTRIKLKNQAKSKVLPSKYMHKYHYWVEDSSKPKANREKFTKPKLNAISKKPTCSNEQLRSMGLRLLDWFLVVMNEELKRKSTQVSSYNLSARNQTAKNLSKLANKKYLPDCEEQASFMFYHFDTDQDLKLSVKELYYLEHDENEHCLEPYLNQCDDNGDHYLTTDEWCSCFTLKSKPCRYHVKHMSKEGLIGGYVPQCTEQGHYQKVQCHASTNFCWCSDKNGNEIAGTRIRGRPLCDKTYPLNRNRFYQNKYINNGDTKKAATVRPNKLNDKVDPYSDLIIDMEDGDVDDGDNFHFDNGSGSDSF